MRSRIPRPLVLVLALLAFTTFAPPSVEAGAPGPGSAISAAAGWGWPLEGQVITAFAQSSDPYAAGDHRGIDIAAAEGTNVVAPISGTVRWTGTLGSGGQMVSLASRNGSHVLSFLHLAKISVARGSSVDVGELIGISGSSGDLRGKPPHLHLGVRVPDGKRLRYVDPLPLLAVTGRAAVPVAKPRAVQPKRKPAQARERAARSAPRPVAKPKVVEPAVTAPRVLPAAESQEARKPSSRAARKARIASAAIPVDPILDPTTPKQSSAIMPGAKAAPTPEHQVASGRIPLILSVVGIAALIGGLAWWRRQLSSPPVLPAQPPRATGLRSVDRPARPPLHKAL